MSFCSFSNSVWPLFLSFHILFLQAVNFPGPTLHSFLLSRISVLRKTTCFSFSVYCSILSSVILSSPFLLLSAHWSVLFCHFHSLIVIIHWVPVGFGWPKSPFVNNASFALYYLVLPVFLLFAVLFLSNVFLHLSCFIVFKHECPSLPLLLLASFPWLEKQWKFEIALKCWINSSFVCFLLFSLLPSIENGYTLFLFLLSPFFPLIRKGKVTGFGPLKLSKSHRTYRVMVQIQRSILHSTHFFHLRRENRVISE